MEAKFHSLEQSKSMIQNTKKAPCLVHTFLGSYCFWHVKVVHMDDVTLEVIGDGGRKAIRL